VTVAGTGGAAAEHFTDPEQMMRAHPFLVALTCVLSLALGSCNTGQGVSNASTHGALRLINVIPNAGGPLNVMFDLQPFVAGLPFEGMTQYQTIDVGAREVQMSVAGSSTNVIDVIPTFLADNNYTMVAFGALANASALILNDTLTVDPGAGMFALRVINGASNNGGVDVYVTPPGEDLNSISPSIAGVAYGTSSGFVNLPTGNLEVRVTAANSKRVIYDAPAQTFVERAQVEAIVYSRGSSTLVNVAFLNIDDAGTGSIANSSLARFKVINGSSLGSPLNVFVDQNLALSNIPYAAASSYQTINAGSPGVTIESAATPGAGLLAFTATFPSATDTAITITGPGGALVATLYSEPNFPPALGRARVRFVNSTMDVPSLDVFVNFSRQVFGLPMNTVSAGIELDADPTAGTAYEFDFNVNGSSQTSLQLPSVVLLGGQLYTIYVVGSGAALSGVVVQDN
jgi:predicted small secreted protein